ncbi:amidoligase family protein [Aestuariibius sp. 2305UL40-4]|uniref:amidoligase family protein n=1 Tax=Aestuariibius violaceus TaxID=3234132 RepID=UPI00345E28DD
MSDLHLTLPRDRFLPLPHGDGRKCGVEIEFGGLREDKAARILADTLGGEIRCDGDTKYTVTGSDIGEIEVYLDTAWRDQIDTAILGQLLEIARSVVPVEIVTEPLPFAALPRLDAARAALRKAGATGSRSGILLGWGVHLNVQLAEETADHILRVTTAFALCDDVIRAFDWVDTSRRIGPFVDPYPRAFIDALCAAERIDMDALITLYLKHNPTRNRALDLLPILAHIAPDRLKEALPDEKISARPAYHYRLPDCRIDEADWSLALEWNRWVVIERIAANFDLMEQLRTDWIEHRGSFTTVRSDWPDRVTERVDQSGLIEELVGEAA